MSRVVVVGTSLGGLEALTTLLRSLPRELAVPIAIAQHRRKVEDDMLQRLLAAQCAIPVLEPHDKEPLEAGRVYLAPSDYHLLIEPASFALSTEGPINYARPSIDLLFESAASAHRSGVIGVVLTGANQDGAMGSRAIKAHGGSVFVQDPETAHCPTMPAAAIAATPVDAILALPELCQRLVAACQQQAH
jgi:two-component system, chemotaxis family, protein-glutamate methylesterase/glutaminase